MFRIIFLILATFFIQVTTAFAYQVPRWFGPGLPDLVVSEDDNQITTLGIDQVTLSSRNDDSNHYGHVLASYTLMTIFKGKSVGAINDYIMDMNCRVSKRLYTTVVYPDGSTEDRKCQEPYQGFYSGSAGEIVYLAIMKKFKL